MSWHGSTSLGLRLSMKSSETMDFSQCLYRETLSTIFEQSNEFSQVLYDSSFCILYSTLYVQNWYPSLLLGALSWQASLVILPHYFEDWTKWIQTQFISKVMEFQWVMNKQFLLHALNFASFSFTTIMSCSLFTPTCSQSIKQEISSTFSSASSLKCKVCWLHAHMYGQTPQIRVACCVGSGTSWRDSWEECAGS